LLCCYFAEFEQVFAVVMAVMIKYTCL